MRLPAILVMTGVLSFVAAAAMAETPDGRPDGAVPGPVTVQSEPAPEHAPVGSDADDPDAVGVRRGEGEAVSTEDLDDGRPPGSVPGPIPSERSAAVEIEEAAGDDGDDPATPTATPAAPPPPESLDQGR